MADPGTRGIAVPYFDESADKIERRGKVIGDIFSAILIGGLIIIFAYSMVFR